MPPYGYIVLHWYQTLQEVMIHLLFEERNASKLLGKPPTDTNIYSDAFRKITPQDSDVHLRFRGEECKLLGKADTSLGCENSPMS